MKRRAGLVQALLNEPEFLIVDEPTTGLDPEERIRIRNLLVDFSADRTILFSTHVVEDLAATCSRLAVMKEGSFLYDGSVKALIDMARGHIWSCLLEEEQRIGMLEKEYCIAAKQYTERGLQLKIISTCKPQLPCAPAEITLEDAYMYVMNRSSV